MSLARLLGLLPFGVALFAAAQNTPSTSTLNFVMPSGPGRIILSIRQSFPLQQIVAYDEGQRPVAQFGDANGMTVSYVLFHNASGNPTGDGCRKEEMDTLLQTLGATASNIVQPVKASSGNQAPVTASYFVKALEGHPVSQQNVLGFWGDATTCFEIHVSKTGYKSSDDGALKAEVTALKPDFAYSADAKDYFRLATLFNKSAPISAIPYYRSALKALPAGPETLRPRRVITDQLAMALGMSGNIPESRSVLQAAIASDPDYPLNYYNLACIDAVQGDAIHAKTHLEEAFARKNNVPKGESLPDPTKETSLQKLNNDAAFWDYAKSLSTSSSQ